MVCGGAASWLLTTQCDVMDAGPRWASYDICSSSALVSLAVCFWTEIIIRAKEPVLRHKHLCGEEEDGPTL